jgi:hypothetical protein
MERSSIQRSKTDIYALTFSNAYPQRRNFAPLMRPIVKFYLPDIRMTVANCPRVPLQLHMSTKKAWRRPGPRPWELPHQARWVYNFIPWCFITEERDRILGQTPTGSRTDWTSWQKGNNTWPVILWPLYWMRYVHLIILLLFLVCVWNIISDIKGRAQTEGVWEQGAEENIWT